MKYDIVPDCQIPVLAKIYENHFTCEKGTFVEIGAFDGRTVSNTCGLADAGWQGCYVEAHPDFARTCGLNHVQNRNVRVINTAVGNREGMIDLYVVGECSSTVWNQTTQDWGGDPNRKIKVPVTTLDVLLERLAVPPSFELLVIDVEGAELDVLRGFTVARWHPQMVIIETHELDANEERNAKAGPIGWYFMGAGYTKIYRDHINGIFVRGASA